MSMEGPVPQDLMTPAEAASFLGVPKNFLERDRWAAGQAGTPPQVPFARLGHKTIRYRRQDLDAYVAERLCN